MIGQKNLRSQLSRLLKIDDHLPYPRAILDVFGQIQHRRRRAGRGRKKYPALKSPLGLHVGVVKKQRDQRGSKNY